MKVKFYDNEDFMVFETDATNEQIEEWCERYVETNDISKPNGCSIWNLIADTELEVRFDIEDIEADLEIDLSKYY